VEKLTFTGFLIRVAFALALVLLTYNPSGYSFVHMLQTGFPAITPLEAVLGLLLLIGWAGVPARNAAFDRAARHGAAAGVFRRAHLADRIVGLGAAVEHRRHRLDLAHRAVADPRRRHVVGVLYRRWSGQATSRTRTTIEMARSSTSSPAASSK
jgi:hypothetical protein